MLNLISTSVVATSNGNYPFLEDRRRFCNSNEVSDLADECQHSESCDCDCSDWNSLNTTVCWPMRFWSFLPLVSIQIFKKFKNSSIQMAVLKSRRSCEEKCPEQLRCSNSCLGDRGRQHYHWSSVLVSKPPHSGSGRSSDLSYEFVARL